MDIWLNDDVGEIELVPMHLFLTSMGYSDAVSNPNSALENGEITHPEIGNQAKSWRADVYLEGVDTDINVRYLTFKQNHVYVYIVSTHVGTITVSLDTLGTAIADKISVYDWSVK